MMSTKNYFRKLVITAVALKKKKKKEKEKEKVANLAGGWVTTNNRGTYGTPAVLQDIVGTHINGPGMLLVQGKR